MRLAQVVSMVTTEQPMLLKVPEAAALLGLSERTAYRLASQGQLPGIKRFGRSVYVVRAVLEAWLQSGGHDGQQRP